MSSGRNSALLAISKDRIITQLPQPYRPEATPYQSIHFHPKVKAACAENRTGRVGLKICKSVIVGDVAVGKTCIVNRFCHDVFNRDYKATIGVDFEVEKFSVLSVPFTLQMWDTAGQERFKCIAASYYRGANIVIVAFDLTDDETLQHVPKWMDEATENADEPLKFLVGTKRDLLSDAEFAEVEVRAMVLAKNLGAEFWPTSSKTGENVQAFFARVVGLIFDDHLQKELEASTAPARQIGKGTHAIKVQRVNSRFLDTKKKAQCCK
ncbi:ras-related protein Rab-34-like [Babylonia areolata]|uniref:ras-related protein Rab-34-like n=1 Tax=Babylonia areolata TaxID=304850 RepID=UPI003FD26A86